SVKVGSVSISFTLNAPMAFGPPGANNAGSTSVKPTVGTTACAPVAPQAHTCTPATPSTVNTPWLTQLVVLIARDNSAGAAPLATGTTPRAEPPAVNLRTITVVASSVSPSPFASNARDASVAAQAIAVSLVPM